MKRQTSIEPSHKIDKEKWRNCIEINRGLIYASTDYLDGITESWYGLIINDYETVMPLPVKQKYFLKYYYTPPFIQQLGIIGKVEIEEIETIIQSITNFIRYGTILFNHTNDWTSVLPKYIKHNNYLIDLFQNFQTISSLFKKNLQTNLQKAQKADLFLKEGMVEEAVRLYQIQNGDKTKHVSNQDYQRLIVLCQQLKAKERVFVKSVYTQSGELVASALFLKDNYRIYNLMPSSSSEGKRLNAMHYLISKVLEEFSSSNYLFDFEGSDITGVAQFYQQFGGIPETYYSWHFNRLPIPLKWLKS